MLRILRRAAETDPKRTLGEFFKPIAEIKKMTELFGVLDDF